jgi:hypothetical protein
MFLLYFHYYNLFTDFILRKQLQKALVVILGCMSATILLTEATLLPSGDSFGSLFGQLFLI